MPTARAEESSGFLRLRRANAAVVAALAPVCVERFQRAADVSVNLAALKKVDSWSQGDFVEKGGWATTPGTEKMNSAVASACVDKLGRLS